MVTLAPPWNRITLAGSEMPEPSRRLPQDGLSVDEVRERSPGSPVAGSARTVGVRMTAACG